MAKPKDQYVLGVEFSDHSFKLVQRNITANLIDLVHIEPLSALQMEEEPAYLGNTLKKTLKLYRKQIRTDRAVFSFPAHSAFLKVLSLDNQAGDLREQVEWEVEQQTIGRTARQVVDWIPMAPPEETLPGGDLDTKMLQADSLDDITELDEALKDKKATRTLPVSSGYTGSPYLVVAADEERVTAYEAALLRARLNPQICDVDLLALLNLFTQSYTAELSDLSLLIDIGPEWTLLCLTQHGRYVDSDRMGGLHWQPAEAAAASMAQLSARIAEMAAAANAPVKTAYFSGELMADPRVRDTALAEYKGDRELFDPFRILSVDAALESQIKPVAPSLAVVTGLTLRNPEDDA